MVVCFIRIIEQRKKNVATTSISSIEYKLESLAHLLQEKHSQACCRSCLHCPVNQDRRVPRRGIPVSAWLSTYLYEETYTSEFQKPNEWDVSYTAAAFLFPPSMLILLSRTAD